MSKTTVAVIFGSRSTEHDVSIVTALSSIIKPLELSQNYSVIPVYIDKLGRWFSDPKLSDISFYTSGKIDQFIEKQKPLMIQFDKGLKLVKSGLKNQTIKIDIVFPALHGTHGEDGEVMALCELANEAYVGCDAKSSSVAMDKVLAKQVAIEEGIATSKFVSFTKNEFEEDSGAWYKKIADELIYPMFVKPAHLGSSIGITRVKNKAELENAIEVALHYDDKALVEEEIANLIEVTLPIMGNEKPQPALLERPMVKPEDFFDFETKYMHGGKKGKNGGQKGAQGYSQLPAELPKKLYDEAEATGVKVYKALGCAGIARVDMLIDSKTSKVYFNEVNPLPGSLYTHNWNRAGISNIELVNKLIGFGFDRFNNRSELSTTFDTSFLKQF